MAPVCERDDGDTGARWFGGGRRLSGKRRWQRVRRVFDVPAAEDVDLEIQSHIDMLTHKTYGYR